jgi:WD40 repeat protein
MSPEQAELNPLDIDTRSDVYSLGVLLYELLAGVPPFVSRNVQAAGILEMLRVIREQEPAKPSTRLSSADTLPTLAANRGTDPDRLARLVRGELDWIVMKALEKDRNRRYETANGLAMDVARYLSDEPVLACPPLALYRLGKFARRHKTLITAATILVTGILTAALALGVSNVRINAALREKGRALEERTEALRDRTEALTAETEARTALMAGIERERETGYVHAVALAHREWQAGRVRYASEILEVCPQEKRHWEWHYRKRLTQVQKWIIPNYSRWQSGGVAATGNGKLLAVFGRHETRGRGVTIWNLESRREVQFLEAEEGGCFALSREGTHLVGGCEHGKVKVWDLATGTRTLTIDAHSNPVAGVEVSPDGQRITSFARDKRVVLWDGRTMKPIREVSDSTLYGVAHFRRDGKRLAVAFGPEITIFDAASGDEILRWKVRLGSAVQRLAFSPSGNTLASVHGAPGVICIWDAESGRQMTFFSIQEASVTALSWYGPSFLAVGDTRGVVRCWNAESSIEQRLYRGHDEALLQLASPIDGSRITSISVDGTVMDWDADAFQEFRTVGMKQIGIRHAMSPDASLLVAGDNAAQNIWDLPRMTRLAALESEFTGVWTIEYDPKGRRVFTAHRDGRIRIFESGNGRPIHVLNGHAPSPAKVNLAVSPDGSLLLSAGGDGCVRLWDTLKGSEIRVVARSLALPIPVGFCPDGMRFAISDARHFNVRIVDARTDKEVAVCRGHDGLVIRIVFSPGEPRLLATASMDGTVRLWDPATGDELHTLDMGGGHVDDVAFSPDGRRLAAVGNELKIWNTSTGKEVMTLWRGTSVGTRQIAFSADGHRLVTRGDDGHARVWDGAPTEQAVR